MPWQDSKLRSSFWGPQWLRHRAPNAGGLGSIPGQRTRSYMLQLKILCATTKIPCSKINKYLKFFILYDFFFLQLHREKISMRGSKCCCNTLLPLPSKSARLGCFLQVVTCQEAFLGHRYKQHPNVSLPYSPTLLHFSPQYFCFFTCLPSVLAFLTLLLCSIFVHSTSVFSLVYYLSPALRCKLNEKEFFSLHLYPRAGTVVAHSGHINSCRL